MADLNIERKQGPTLWPWLIGLVVLGLLIWAIAELVNTDRDKTMAEADDSAGPASTAVASGAAPPASAAPANAAPGAPAAEETPLSLAPLGALMPLGSQDIGQQVTASGEVLTTPENGGFWLRTENNGLIWVRSPQRLKQGQQVQDIPGILRQAQPGQPGAALDPDLQTTVAKRGLAFAPGLFLDASPAGSSSGGTNGRVTSRATGASRAGGEKRKPAAKGTD